MTCDDDDGAVMMRIVVNAVDDDADHHHHITRSCSCSRTFGLLDAQQCMKPDDDRLSSIIVCNLLWYSHLYSSLLPKAILNANISEENLFLLLGMSFLFRLLVRDYVKGTAGLDVRTFLRVVSFFELRLDMILYS